MGFVVLDGRGMVIGGGYTVGGSRGGGGGVGDVFF